MLAAVPLGAIRHFGKNKTRGDRVQRLGEIKHARPIGAARHHVGEKFVGAPLGADARHHIRRPAGGGENFNERKFFIERGNNIGVSDFLPAVKRQLALLLRRFDYSLPIRLPL